MASKKPQIEVETSWMKEKLDIWVALPDSEKTNICYKRGIIIKVVGQDVTIRNENGNEEVVHASRVSAANSYLDLPDGFDDMVDMEHLSEAELLYNLHERYKTGKIFTYVGPTLIVLNPYCMIPELFTAEVLAQFQNSVRELRFEPKDLMPHVYALGAASMTNLIRDQKNQAIVISGESGAGKTENTKFAMKFLTSLNDAGGKKKSDEVSIEDKILACNPVLEAFGNAKTVRNDNSSRFGKYVSLLVAKGSNQRILGATITNYLLEKSRVCLQSNGERNYHIFYHLFKGASIKELEALYLAKDGVSLMEKFEYLNKSGCYAVPTLDDKELYDEVVSSFRTMEFKPDEQRAIWALVASTLLLGQLRYDDSTLTDKTPCKFVDETPLKQACELLELDYEETSKAIRYKFRSVQGQVIESPLNKMDCVVTRDSLSKELYNKLFTWLVKRLNFTVMPAEMLEDGADTMQLLNNYYHIGLLDIFGFEIFKFNSLEQLCINYTNEKLQQLYIFYVFKNEEKVFIQEGLQDFLCELNFEDNQPVIDLLDAPPVGIFQMIDESSQVNMTDENLCSKIIKQHGTNPKLTTPKMSKLTFIVNHTASSVEYNTDGFAFKNRDELSPYIEKALFNSKFEMVPKVYKGLCGNQKESEEAGAKKDAKTDKFLGAKFRLQMKDLMIELQSCDCHFIRCIKPNDRKEKKLFLPYLTLQQIMYMGILDTIKVRKDSYPIRRLYRTFFQKYGELSTKHAKKSFEQHCKDGADFKAMSLVIQRNVLRWLYTKRIVQDRNQSYLPAARTDLENRRKLEITTLFGGIKDQKDPDALNRVKKVDAYSNKKINLFMKVIDLDAVADTSDIYDPSWSVQLLELQNAVNENTDVELQMIDVGEAHTLAISNNPKVYGWGWNDHFQLVTLSQPGGGLALSPEEIKFPVADFRPKQFAAGDEHNILLDTNNNLFVWGSNRKAQFGLGHCNEVGCMTNISFTNGDRVTAVKAKGHNNLAITESGAAYYWPLYKLSGDVVTRPVMMSLPPKIQIQSGSCGFNFAILLSRNGLLFSFGIDNSAGQLGLGHTSPKEEPMLIETLKTEGERVTEVSCGYKHVICKTALGKVYTWGWGEKGQLGNNSLSNSKVPRLLDTSIIGVTKSKVVQVQAGFRHSLILAESRRVYWMGTNGSMINNARLTELDLSGKIPSFTNATDLAPIKILTAWSKTMSVTYLTIADTRTVDQPNPAKDKILSLMIQKLDEYSAHADLDLPLVDHVSKYFVARAVKATAEVSPFKARTMPSTTTNAQASKRVNVTSFNTPKSQTMKPFFLSKAREDALSHIKEVPEYIAPKEVASSPQKPNLTDRLTDASPKKSSPTKSSPTTKEQEKSRKPAIIIPESPKTLTTPIQLTPKDMSSQKQASDVEMKLREIKRKFEKLVLIPKEKWNEKEREFMKIATDPKVFKKLEQIK